MKANWNFILLYISIGIFISCNKSTNKEEQIYNGIDSQILNIVDSISIQSKQYPFITILFTACPDSDFVVKFINNVLIPVPLPPPAPIKEMLISEGYGFSGYKKYDDVCLVFMDYIKNGNLEKFVCKDSLNFDEEPFIHFRVYEWDGRSIDCKTIEKNYLINEKDSLVLFEGKCKFDVE
ncbi:MAG: hypothetical protein LBO74_01845 [Candidatus Symbiothrix sp.]|jgi:hypothetical protein|nr:hypothetical protein [Candidatus Symbiothrix sp.]